MWEVCEKRWKVVATHSCTVLILTLGSILMVFVCAVFVVVAGFLLSFLFSLDTKPA